MYVSINKKLVIFLKYYTHFRMVKPKGKQENISWFAYEFYFYHKSFNKRMSLQAT